MSVRSHLEGLWSAELIGHHESTHVGILVFQAEVLDHLRLVVDTEADAAEDTAFIVAIAEHPSRAKHQNADVGAAIAFAQLGRLQAFQEYHTFTRCIQEGIDLGIFEPVDAGRTAEWISTQLDGLMVRSKIFPDLDVKATIDSLREMLWTHLGYRRQPAAT